MKPTVVASHTDPLDAAEGTSWSGLLERTGISAQAGAPAERMLTIRGGRVVRVRRLRPDDAAELALALGRLSAQSRYYRFLAPRHRFTTRELTALATVDGHRSDAWAALHPAQPSFIAVARYAAWPDDPSVADVAITVGDAWQHQGLGGALLDLVMERAAQEGFTGLRADVLAENRAAHRLLIGRGFRRAGLRRGVEELERALPLAGV
jgi:acetyltransferase